MIFLHEAYRLADLPEASGSVATLKESIYRECLFERGVVMLDDGCHWSGCHMVDCNYIILKEGVQIHGAVCFKNVEIIDSHFEGVTFLLGVKTAAKFQEAAGGTIRFLFTSPAV